MRRTANRDANQSIRDFLVRVANRDPVLLREITETPAFELRESQWRFSLPDLHAFLQRHCEPVASLDYRTFRKHLYRSPVNADLAPFNCRVVILDNRANVDQSLYALEWSAAASDP